MFMRKCIPVFVAAAILTGLSVAGADAQSEEKSAKKAFFYSLLLPGLGQHYAGSTGSIKYFAAAEILMFGAVLGHDTYSKWLEEDYRTFAVQHAGVDPAGKSKNYYVDISKYNSIYIFNEKARINRDPDGVIPETEENIWMWDSRDNRLKFHYMRVDADRIGNRSIYFHTALFVNHLISGIHAALIVRRAGEKQRRSNTSLKLIPDLNPYNPLLRLRLSYTF